MWNKYFTPRCSQRSVFPHEGSRFSQMGPIFWLCNFPGLLWVFPPHYLSLHMNTKRWRKWMLYLRIPLPKTLKRKRTHCRCKNCHSSLCVYHTISCTSRESQARSSLAQSTEGARSRASIRLRTVSSCHTASLPVWQAAPPPPSLGEEKPRCPSVWTSRERRTHQSLKRRRLKGQSTNRTHVGIIENEHAARHYNYFVTSIYLKGSLQSLWCSNYVKTTVGWNCRETKVVSITSSCSNFSFSYRAEKNLVEKKEAMASKSTKLQGLI